MINNVMKKIIRFYQKHISVLHKPCCRYIPTCSNYALQAYEKHGFIKGTILSVYRILRCNPFSKGGYDPVPDKFYIIKIRKGNK